MFLVYNVALPPNVDMVLNNLKSAMELGLGDAVPIKVDVSGIKVPDYKPMDLVLYFGLPAIIIFTGLFYGIIKCLKRCGKVKEMLLAVINSVFLGGIMRSIFCLYLVLCAKSDID